MLLWCVQMLQGAADMAPNHTEALVHELLLRSSQDRRLAIDSTAALLSSMPLSRSGLLPITTVPSLSVCSPGCFLTVPC